MTFFRSQSMAVKKSPSSTRRLLSEFWKGRLNRFAFCLLLLIFAVGLFAPFIANDKPLYFSIQGRRYFPVLQDFIPKSWWRLYPEISFDDFQTSPLLQEKDVTVFWPLIPQGPNQYNLDSVLLSPSADHWLGTDIQGRDLASRLIYGTRISLSVGFVAVSLYVSIGILMGGLAGYFGGWVDFAIGRLIEVVICFPTLFLVLAILAFLGPSIINVMIVLGITGWTGVARLVRAEILKQRKSDYVQAAKAMGCSSARILFRHLLPNILTPVIVTASFGIAGAILAESSLSFLGFGVEPPTPSWGDSLSSSLEFIDFAWWATLFPGFAIFITLLAWNLLGEGLRDALDPASKR